MLFMKSEIYTAEIHTSLFPTEIINKQRGPFSEIKSCQKIDPMQKMLRPFASSSAAKNWKTLESAKGSLNAFKKLGWS